MLMTIMTRLATAHGRREYPDDGGREIDHTPSPSLRMRSRSASVSRVDSVSMRATLAAPPASAIMAATRGDEEL